MNKHSESAGFTLIEVLIALAIVGILAAIAYPSYTEQVRTSRRADAQGALYGLQQAMERYSTVNNTYTGALIGEVVGSIYPSQVPLSGGTPTYQLSLEVNDAGTGFALRAQPTNAQASDRCGALTLTSENQRGIADAQPGLVAGDCWRT